MILIMRPCIIANSGGMHRIHKHADSCNMRCSAFLSVDLAFANTTTNMLIMQKGFRAKPWEILW